MPDENTNLKSYLYAMDATIDITIELCKLELTLFDKLDSQRILSSALDLFYTIITCLTGNIQSEMYPTMYNQLEQLINRLCSRYNKMTVDIPENIENAPFHPNFKKKS